MTPIDYNNPNEPWFNTGYDPYKGMSDKERMKAGCLHGAIFIVAIIVFFAMCALFSGCTTTQYVPVPEYHTDTMLMVKVQHDSLVLKDSVYIHDKGDTVLIERWHTQWRDRIVHDTIYQSKRDSIPAPYPVEVTKEVPADLTWWQQTRLYIADILLVAVIGAILVWFWKRRRR